LQAATVRELVVISGKGGTGKTSLLASFAVLAGKAMLADCDVDAADLHLVLTPTIRRRETFRSGHQAVIRPELCRGCGKCRELCRFGAVSQYTGNGRGPVFRIDPAACEGCGVCVDHCPADAIQFPERVCGEWYLSDTRCGPMVHARLQAAAENSGKLVATVRQAAHAEAKAGGYRLILVDGPPGIGCPVIASITGASAVLVVTEPTVAGEHDLQRVLALCMHFRIPAHVCVNKWDLNQEMTESIERLAREKGARVAGRIPYDRTVTLAQVQARAVVEMGGPAAQAMRQVWERLTAIGEDNAAAIQAEKRAN
jgi:MinD superfamily P-loop ATPase